MEVVSNRGRTRTRSRISRPASYPGPDRTEEVLVRREAQALFAHNHSSGRAISLPPLDKYTASSTSGRASYGVTPRSPPPSLIPTATAVVTAAAKQQHNDQDDYQKRHMRSPYLPVHCRPAGAGRFTDHVPIAVYRHVESALKGLRAPVPLHQNPAAFLVNPPVCYPAGMRPGRLFPSSRRPGVRVAVPTLVTRNPHMVTAGRRRPSLDYNTGWRNTNHNIRGYGAEGQSTRKQQPDQAFRNHTFHHSRDLDSARSWPRTDALTCH